MDLDNPTAASDIAIASKVAYWTTLKPKIHLKSHEPAVISYEFKYNFITRVIIMDLETWFRVQP
jgi:hypothetical protein